MSRLIYLLKGTSADTSSDFLSQEECAAFDTVLSSNTIWSNIDQFNAKTTQQTLRSVRCDDGHHSLPSPAQLDACSLTLSSDDIQFKAHEVEQDALETVCDTLHLLATRQHSSQGNWPSSTSIALSKEQERAIDTLSESKILSLLGLTNAQAEKKKAWLYGLKHGILEEEVDPRAPGGVTSIWTQRMWKRYWKMEKGFITSLLDENWKRLISFASL